MELKRQYIVDEANQKVAVQLDIATFEKIENVLENYALVHLMSDDDSELMTTLVLDDDLINKVLQIGNYQTPQEAIVAILSGYIESHEPKKTLFDKSYLDVDMADGEIDSLFERDKDVGEI